VEEKKPTKEEGQRGWRKVMKLILVFFIAVSVWASGYSVSSAEDLTNANGNEVICFSVEDVRKVLANEMQCDITKEQLKNCEELNLNKDEMVSKYKEEIKLLEEKNMKCDETVNELKKTIDEERKVIKNIRSGGIGEYLKILGYFGLGVLVGILL
jgi:regulator of RNase E activity RraB